MSVREIVKAWEGETLLEENVKFLSQPLKKVQFPLSEHTQKIITDLKDTANAIPCAGIAANQIGYSERVFVGYKDNQLELYSIYINPKILKKTESSIRKPYPSAQDYYSDNDALHRDCSMEACLSIPEVNMTFQRCDTISVEYQDEEGVVRNEERSGFLSKLFQHELDHLNGLTVANRIIYSIHKKKEGAFFPAVESVKDKSKIKDFVKNREKVFKYLYDYMLANLLCSCYLNKLHCSDCI